MKTNTTKSLTWRLLNTLIAIAAIGLASGNAEPESRQQKDQQTKREAHGSETVSQLVTNYEAVSEALVRDELIAAQEASATLAANAKRHNNPDIAQAADKVAGATNLEETRVQFKKLSSQVIALAKGNDDYTVMTCPMVENGRWLQSDEQVSNPYMGQKMPRCGMPESK